MLKGCLLNLCFTSHASTSASTIIFNSRWKRPWKRHKHKRKLKHKDPFSCACAYACVCAATSKNEIPLRHDPSTKIFPHVVMFRQWKHWIQIISRLSSFSNRQKVRVIVCVSVEFRFHLIAYVCACYCPCVASENQPYIVHCYWKAKLMFIVT